MPPTVSTTARRFLTGALLTFGLGLVLFALVRLGLVAPSDERLTAAIHRAAVGHQLISQIAETLTMIGNPVVLTILVAVSAVRLLTTGHGRIALWLLIVTAGGATIETGLKLLIGRTRPGFGNVLLEAHGTSFPSGHAMNTTIVLGAITLAISQAVSLGPVATRVLLAVAATVSLGVAATRVLIGVHYLSDVTAGFVLATFWLGLTGNAPAAPGV